MYDVNFTWKSYIRRYDFNVSEMCGIAHKAADDIKSRSV
jgi:hypothetical protein